MQKYLHPYRNIFQQKAQTKLAFELSHSVSFAQQRYKKVNVALTLEVCALAADVLVTLCLSKCATLFHPSVCHQCLCRATL